MGRWAWSRDAEEFDSLVSGSADLRVGSDAGSGDDPRAELLELVTALRAVPPVTARSEFVSSLRAQLVAEAERMAAGADDDLAARLTPRQRRSWRERRVAVLVGGVAIVAATGSMAVASQDALPGDVLYPVKRAIENAQTNLRNDQEAKAAALLAHARSRLDETEELVAAGADGEDVAKSLQDFTDQSRQAADLTLDAFAENGDAEPVEDLRAFADDSMEVLASLGDTIPEDARAALIAATQTIREIDMAAWEACSTCSGGDVTELPDFAALSLSAPIEPTVPETPAPTTPADPAPPQAPAPTPTVPAPAPSAPAAPAPGTSPVPVLPSESPTPDSLLGSVGKTVTGLTDGLGLTQTQTDPADPESTSGTLVGGVVGGVTGLLATLLGTGD